MKTGQSTKTEALYVPQSYDAVDQMNQEATVSAGCDRTRHRSARRHLNTDESHT